MAENWIEKAVDEIGNSAIGDKEHWKQIILSHAPVTIDAEELAEKIHKAGLLDAIQFTTTTPCPARTSGIYIQQDYERAKKALAQLITSNLDLSITFVDGKAEWGDFRLSVRSGSICSFWELACSVDIDTFPYVNVKEDRLLRCGTTPKIDPKSAQAACVDALKEIITGQKE